MKILYHHRTQADGAEGVHIREVIQALRALNNEICLISPPGVDPFKTSNPNQSTTKTSFKKQIIYALPQIFFEFLEISYNFWAKRKINQAIKSFKPDFIYERYAFFCKAATDLAIKNKIPLILEVNEISGIKRQRAQRLVGLCKKYEQHIFLKASAIVVVSDFLKDQIKQRGIPEEKIFVIPNAVNLDDFNLSETGKTIKNTFKLNDQFLITFIGMFSKWDSLEFLIDSFNQIFKQNPQTHLMIVGEGTQRPLLEEHAQKLGISKSITFAGKVSRKQIPQFIAASDICLLSGSNPFGSPMAMFEYMAMKKPIVVPKYGPIESVVKDGINGLLFNPGQMQDFCAAIIKLINSPELRQQLSNNAHQTIIENHLWIHNGQKILNIYQEVKN